MITNEDNTLAPEVARSAQAQPSVTWDQYFMLQALTAAFKSKDPSTKVGCVLVDKNNHQISMGYNGFIAGIDETKLTWAKDTNLGLAEQKYGYVVHAEANAILHSSRSLEGARCYITLFPCNECAKMLASKNIGEVIYLSDKNGEQEQTKVAKRIFDLMNIPVRKVSITEDLLTNLNSHFRRILEGY